MLHCHTMMMMNKLADAGLCQRRQALLTLDISSMKELVSAQQRMYILVVSHIHLSTSLNSIEKKRHHQNTNTISFHVNSTTSFIHNIIHAIRRGNNRVVLREWKHGACWWNLNNCNNVRGSAHNNIDSSDSDTCATMARAEVAGYRLARLAMNYYHDKCNNSGNCSSKSNSNSTRKRVYMPEVLYFSHDDNFNDKIPPPPILVSLQSNGSSSISSYEKDQCINNTPWALISYFDNGVNHDDNDYDGSQQTPENLIVEVDSEDDLQICNFNDVNINSITNNGEEKNDVLHIISSKATTTTIPCHHFPTTMIQIRREFGYNEPHPRHGRVPIDECLDYALMILYNVVMPLQTYFFMLRCSNAHNNTESIDNYLISIGHDGNTTNTNNTKHTTNRKVAQPFQYHDMIVIYRHALHRLTTAHNNNNHDDDKDDISERDTRMDFILQMLHECITALDCEWDEYNRDGQPPHLPPVLCHMDLQPQNLAFGHDAEESNDVSFDNNTSADDDGTKQIPKHCTKDCYVTSVMDWEEACYADPRFELLLLCRKVLANIDQAQILWQTYSDCIQRLDNDLQHASNDKDSIQQQQQWNVGPIEPWLRLEAVHSICTLLLQSMNLLGGGRSPWETKPDLWGKIDRERQRLVQLGWLFCDCNNNEK